MIKVHRPLFEGIVGSLSQIFDEGHHADKVIQRTLKFNKKWGSRDRRVFAETVYEIVRWKKTLDALYTQLGGTQLKPYREWTEIWLTGLQEDFEWVTSPNFPTLGEIRKLYKNLSPADKESFPDWLYELGQKEFGSKWTQLMIALNQKAPVFLRVNTLKTDAKTVEAELQEEGYPVKVLSDETIVLVERKNIFISKTFKKGYFEIQDLSSQKVADYVDPKPGEFVIDACAGAGGKALHLAARMKNKGRIVALDIQEKKLLELKLRSRRAGVDNLESKWIESSKTIKRLKGRADRLLLDVPCSGLGVLRRNPDAKWKLSLERIKELEDIQSQILSQYSEMLKPGGTLVYSTCSILPSENEKQVQKFLSQNKAFVLVDELKILPEEGGGDGFYIAKMENRA